MDSAAESICAVIVWYHPSMDTVSTVAAISQQVSKVVIVDNGSASEVWECVRQQCDPTKVIKLGEGTNLGIGAGMNIGARFAIENGFDWLATFDQDSHPDGDFIDKMMQLYGGWADSDRVAIIAPRYVDRISGDEIGGSEGINDEVGVTTTMSSGSVIKSAAFKKVGYFREDYFIDSVDHEFCLRCRRHGFVIRRARNAVLAHRLGASTRVKFLWMRPLSTNHSPLRRYYMARNRMLLYKEYAFAEPAWIWADFKMFLKEMAIVILCEEKAVVKMLQGMRGVYHGIIGRSGPRK